MRKKVILISGKMQSGKNSFAEYIKQQFRSRGYSTKEDLFAKGVKDGCKSDFKMVTNYINKIVAETITILSIYDTIYKEHNKDAKKRLKDLVITDNNWYEDKTELSRLLLQTYGTEIFRNKVGINYWVDMIKKRAKSSKKDVYIITDTRFPNEIINLYDNKYDLISIRINKKMNRISKKDNHSSEKALDGFKEWNYIVDNNKDLKTLQKSSRTIARDIIEMEENNAIV